MNLVIVVGTRPEIVKMAPVLIELEKRKLDFSFIENDIGWFFRLAADCQGIVPGIFQESTPSFSQIAVVERFPVTLK